MPASRRSLLSLLCALPLAGCGFQLRGRAELPFDTIFVAPDNKSPLRGEIVRRVEAETNARVVSSPDEAQVVLTILSTQRSSDALTLNIRRKAVEYALTETISFRVATPAGERLLPDSSLSFERDISYSEREQLSQSLKREVAYRAIEQEAAGLIIRRLVTARAPSKPKPAAAP